MPDNDGAQVASTAPKNRQLSDLEAMAAVLYMLDGERIALLEKRLETLKELHNQDEVGRAAFEIANRIPRTKKPFERLRR